MSRKRPKSNYQEHKMASLLDDLAEFEEMQRDLLPSIKADLKKGMSADAMLGKYHPIAAARLLSIAATSENPSIALAALKDVLDRSMGKAKERQEITHKLEKLPDEQLDALLMSQMDQVDEDEARH